MKLFFNLFSYLLICSLHSTYSWLATFSRDTKSLENTCFVIITVYLSYPAAISESTQIRTSQIGERNISQTALPFTVGIRALRTLKEQRKWRQTNITRVTNCSSCNNDWNINMLADHSKLQRQMAAAGPCFINSFQYLSIHL